LTGGAAEQSSPRAKRTIRKKNFFIKVTV